MDAFNNYQIAQAVNNGLNDMNIPVTQQIANDVMNCIIPFIRNEISMASQSNQAVLSLQATINSLMIENRAQVMQIARLSQTHQEMPRMFAVNPANGFGYCMDGGKEKIIGKIKINSIYNCIIEKKGIKKTIKYIGYFDSNDEFHHTIVHLDKLAGKNLLTLFEGFIYICKSKELANDYLAHCINNFDSEDNMFFPEYPGFCFFNYKDEEMGRFYCNTGFIETELLKECSPYYVKKAIPEEKADLNSAVAIFDKYLNTDEKKFLFVYSICGLLSSFLKKINCPLEQILVISAPDSTAVRQATNILQIFNRGEKTLSFDSSKSDIAKALIHSKDETVIINDCSLIDNDRRRTEMLQHILSVNDNNECQTHNLAIISSHAQFILPPEKKICLTLPDDFAVNMTKAEETEMCRALNSLVNMITDYICKNYTEFKNIFNDFLLFLIDKKRHNFNNSESALSYCILWAVQLCAIEDVFQIKEVFTSKNMSKFINMIFTNSSVVSGTSADAVSEQFIMSLNQAVRNGKLKITAHSKKMNFIEGTNQLIVKDDLLLMEESTVEKIILPAMRTTNNVCRTLKCLDECGYLYSNKKNRYSLVIYSDKKSRRLSFIAVKRGDILSPESEQIINESKYAEWYACGYKIQNHIPICTNSIGDVSYQIFDFQHKNNMHFFAVGNSSSGKTHCLTERMVSLQKLNYPVIIFDTSDSFTEEEILEKLSVGGDESVVSEVKKYISDNITFHNIEENGIPVNILDLEYSNNKEQKIREIQSVVESHNSNMGVKQKSAIYNAISDIISQNNIDMLSLYKALTSEDIPYNLVEQLIDTLSFFVNFELSDRSWGEFINESKEIIIISSNSVNSSDGSGLIDMLLMSLFYYQKTNKDKHISIFIDEIKSQNLNVKGPIAKILTEGRKYHIGLNFATQFLPKSEEVKMIMNNADTKAFFQLDDRAAVSAAKLLDIQPNELFFLEKGECYIKGTLYNQKEKRAMPGIIRGRTYRNFLQGKK